MMQSVAAWKTQLDGILHSGIAQSIQLIDAVLRQDATEEDNDDDRTVVSRVKRRRLTEEQDDENKENIPPKRKRSSEPTIHEMEAVVLSETEYLLERSSHRAYKEALTRHIPH